MDYAFYVIWSRLKTYLWGTFVDDDFAVLQKLVKRHDCSLDDLENAVGFLKYYGYLRDLRGGLPEYSLAGAAKHFQALMRIVVDGVIGPETLEAMLAPRCGNPDTVIWEQIRWRKNKLGVHVEGYVPILSRADQIDLMQLAFDGWSKHADVTFHFVGEKSRADIYIQAVPLDGPGRVLAQAQLPPGDDRPLFLQMDSGEAKWARALQGVRGDILYLNVFAHELGHNLGLGHSGSRGNLNVPPATPLMAPMYNPSVFAPMPDDDVPRIVGLYGPTKTFPPTPTDPPPVPPPGGKKVTKEQLKLWITNMAKLVAGVAAWMIGPFAFAKPHLTTLAGFLETLAANDFLLDLLLMLVARGQLTLPMVESEVAQLKADVEALTAE
jgi:hypothetical protein